MADQLSADDALCFFVSREIPEALRSELQYRGHKLSRLTNISRTIPSSELEHSSWLKVDQEADAAETVLLLSECSWDWLIVDHYAIDSRWESIVRPAVQHIMVIDDLADRSHSCELLLDQNLVANINARYIGKVPATCGLLLGPTYALLDSSFAKLHEIVPARVEISRILIYFGGVDDHDLTYRTLKIVLSEIRDLISVDVVLPNTANSFEDIKRLANMHSNATCHRTLPTLAPLIASADLSFGAMGSTTWERLCLGLPTIAITTATNQHQVAIELDKAGVVSWLGDGDTVTDQAISESLAKVLNGDSLTSWSARCRQICDGKGVQRVVKRMREYEQHYR